MPNYPVFYNPSTGLQFSFQTGYIDVPSSGGGGSPAGSDTEIQFNNAGEFGASADFTWLDGSRNLILGSSSDTGGDTTIDLKGNGHDIVINMSRSTGNLSLSTDNQIWVYGNEGVLLLPPITTTQRDAIASPAEGMMIWNSTTHLPNWYNGTGWKTFTAVDA